MVGEEAGGMEIMLENLGEKRYNVITLSQTIS